MFWPSSIPNTTLPNVQSKILPMSELRGNSTRNPGKVENGCKNRIKKLEREIKACENIINAQREKIDEKMEGTIRKPKRISQSLKTTTWSKEWKTLNKKSTRS